MMGDSLMRPTLWLRLVGRTRGSADALPIARRGARRTSWPVLVVLAIAVSASSGSTSGANASKDGKGWVGTWAAAPQPALPGSVQSFHNQTLRLIVHTSIGGTKIRIKISNTF